MNYEVSGTTIHSIGNSIILDTQGTGTVYDSHVFGSHLIRADMGKSIIHGSNIMSSTIRSAQVSQCGITSSSVNMVNSSGSQISHCTIMGGGRLITSDCQLNSVDIMCHEDSTMYLSEVFDSTIHFKGKISIMRSFISGVSMVVSGGVIDGASIREQSHFASFLHDGSPVMLYRSVRGKPSMMVHYQGVTCQVDSITCSAISMGKVDSLTGIDDMGEVSTMDISPHIVGQWAQQCPAMFA